MKLKTTINKSKVIIDLPGVEQDAYDRSLSMLDAELAIPKTKNREAIAAAFKHLLKTCPDANASDLWHHVIYRQYCDVFNNHRPQDPKQSWVRASGEALEIVLDEIYTPEFSKHGILIDALVSANKKLEALTEMGLHKKVGAGKLDLALYLADTREIIGGVHVKVSLAERVSDDVPTSRAMMEAGYISPLWTLDVKSFPPPTGDLINRGELGTSANPSEKRKYIEEHGDFDHCYSGNDRSSPSKGKTTSGKSVYFIKLSQQPDKFAKDIIAYAEEMRKK